MSRAKNAKAANQIRLGKIYFAPPSTRSGHAWRETNPKQVPQNSMAGCSKGLRGEARENRSFGFRSGQARLKVYLISTLERGD